MIWYFYDFSTLYFQFLNNTNLTKQNNSTGKGMGGQEAQAHVAQLAGLAAHQRIRDSSPWPAAAHTAKA